MDELTRHCIVGLIFISLVTCLAGFQVSGLSSPLNQPNVLSYGPSESLYTEHHGAGFTEGQVQRILKIVDQALVAKIYLDEQADAIYNKMQDYFGGPWAVIVANDSNWGHAANDSDSKWIMLTNYSEKQRNVYIWKPMCEQVISGHQYNLMTAHEDRLKEGSTRGQDISQQMMDQFRSWAMALKEQPRSYTQVADTLKIRVEYWWKGLWEVSIFQTNYFGFAQNISPSKYLYIYEIGHGKWHYLVTKARC